jgi:hypothetical protein
MAGVHTCEWRPFNKVSGPHIAVSIARRPEKRGMNSFFWDLDETTVGSMRKGS